MSSRDPLQQAARSIQNQGLAMKPCEECFRAGRPFFAPTVFVGRAIGGLHDGKCWVVYRCEHPDCGYEQDYPIPPQMLLAREFRLDALSRIEVDEAPTVFYSIEKSPEGDILTVYVDAADDRPPIALTKGKLTPNGDAHRVCMVLDFIAGGDAERAAPEST